MSPECDCQSATWNRKQAVLESSLSCALSWGGASGEERQGARAAKHAERQVTP
jgi:hypothetical protein